MTVMRGTLIFVCGALAGLLLDTGGSAGSDSGLHTINLIGLAVDDMDESLAFYTEIVGFQKVFTLANEDGEVGVAYLKAGENIFLQLNSSDGRLRPGFTHIGIRIDGMEAEKAIYAARGAQLTETFQDQNQASRSFFTDPQGVPIELFEYAPESALGAVLAGQ